MASAVLSYLVERAAARGEPRPIALTLEPEAAACAYESPALVFFEMLSKFYQRFMSNSSKIFINFCIQ